MLTADYIPEDDKVLVLRDITNHPRTNSFEVSRRLNLPLLRVSYFITELYSNGDLTYHPEDATFAPTSLAAN